jgi:hypothetical protein
MGFPKSSDAFPTFYWLMLRYAQTGIEEIENETKTFREAHAYRNGWNAFKVVLKEEAREAFREAGREKNETRREQEIRVAKELMEQARRAAQWKLVVVTPKGRANIRKDEGETSETGPCKIIFTRKGETKEEKRITQEFESAMLEKLGPSASSASHFDFLPQPPENIEDLDIDDLFDDMDTDEKPVGKKL